METKENAYAKLNLSLDVLGKRPDGYHDLRMVMCSVELADEVTVALRSDGRINVNSNFPWLPRDSRNLAVKAAEAFFDAVGEPNPGLDIQMFKRVPVGAGMAGGSANAAAVLRALNRLTHAGMDAAQLRRIGLTVGSDVPYCIEGGSALAEGRGELLTPIGWIPACSVVICKPAFSISSADLFRRIDLKPPRTHPDTAGMLQAIAAGELDAVARRMYNVFEDALPRSCAEIHTIRGALLDAGALGAVMTGTGSAVFGLFDREETAREAWERLKKAYRDCFLTQIRSETFFEE